MISEDTKQTSREDKWELQSAYWICRLFVSIQVVLCFLLNLGDRGRVIAILVLSISIVLGNRFKLSRSLHAVLVVGSGFLFSCFAISRLFGTQSAGLLDLFELLAEFLIIVQSLELLRKRSDSLWSFRESNYLPGLGTIAIIMLLVSRDVSLSPSVLAYLFTGLAIFLLLMMRPDIVNLIVGNRIQRQKAITIATIVAVGTTAGSLFQGEVSRQLPLLQTALRAVQPPSDQVERISFTTQAMMVDQVGLSSIASAQRTAPDELVFRVEASQPPGYMRTLSFESFDGQEWSNGWNVRRRTEGSGPRWHQPLADLPAEIASFNKPQNAEFYALPERQSGDYKEMNVAVPRGHGQLVPLPLASAFIVATPQGKSRSLALDMHGNVWPNSISNNEYRIFVGANSTWPVDDSYANRLLQLPTVDTEFIKSHAAKICGTAVSTNDKVKALEDYFVNGFEYSFEDDAIGERRGRSPLRAFLENRQAGHCEYFATASVLLLRAQGIPCRLSTGYLVFQMNDDREYYYARNRDAHAWAEAFDASSAKWILVESTPGIRTLIERFGPGASTLIQANDRGVRADYSSGQGLLAILQFVQAWWNRLLASRFAWLLPLALGGLLWQLRLKRTRRKKIVHSVPVSPAIRQADRRASRRGCQRSASETCIQFAKRLSETREPELIKLAEWYLSHSKSRYVEK